MSNANPKFGPGGNSIAFYDAKKKHTLQAPEWLNSIGLSAYEYEAGNGIAASIETFSKIGEEGKKYNIKMSLHAPYFISLSGVDVEKRLKSIDYISKSVEAAKALFADIIVVHCGSAAKISREEAMSLSADTLYKTLEEVQDNGVKIGIETMGKVNQLGTLEEVISLCKIDRRLVPVVDFGHLNARQCGGRFPSSDEYSYVFDKISTELGADVAENLHCHFSKIEWTGAGEKKHLTFEDSSFGPDFEPLIEAIYKLGVSPTIICESAGTQSDDALAMKNYFDKMRKG